MLELTICTFHSRMAGRIDRLKSVTISTAEKNKPTFVLRAKSQVPLDSPHRVLIGRPVKL